MSFLKVVLPLAFGVFLIWYVFNDLTTEEKDELFMSFRKADYFWVGISMIFGVLSHLSRAYRWKYTLQPLNYKPNFWNSFYAVMIGYITNLALPRVGEVSRCAALAKSDNMKFNKLFGTVIAERVADLLILVTLSTLVIVTQLDEIGDLLADMAEQGSDKFSAKTILIIVGALVLGGGILFFVLLRKSNNPFFKKIRELLLGVVEGVKTILQMENTLYFILHTIFIWLMYIGMFYIALYSLTDASNIPVWGLLAGFVIGGLSIVLVQGGIGVYPVAIMNTLMIYGVAKTTSLALGWIIWSAQTLLIIVLGVISIILIKNSNKKEEHVTAGNNKE